MSSSFPNGTVFSIGTAYGSDVTISSVSNANPGVASATAHGLSDADIILLSVSSSRLDGKVVRVDSSTTDTFELEGINTTSTTLYPTGFGAGTAKDVTTWVPMSQVSDTASEGGEPNFATWVFLDDGKQRRRPTFTNARGLTLTMHYDPSLAWHDALINAAQLGTIHAIRAALPSGAFLYYGAYIAFDGEPTFTVNVNQEVSLNMSFTNTHTRYAS